MTSDVMRWRQLGYGVSEWDNREWRAVWLDMESVDSSNLRIVYFPTDAKHEVVFTGTIYRTIKDVQGVVKA